MIGRRTKRTPLIGRRTKRARAAAALCPSALWLVLELVLKLVFRRLPVCSLDSVRVSVRVPPPALRLSGRATRDDSARSGDAATRRSRASARDWPTAEARAADWPTDERAERGSGAPAHVLERRTFSLLDLEPLLDLLNNADEGCEGGAIPVFDLPVDDKAPLAAATGVPSAPNFRCLRVRTQCKC